MKLYEFSIYAFRLCGAAPAAFSHSLPQRRHLYHVTLIMMASLLMMIAFTALPLRRCLYGVAFTALPSRRCLHGVTYTTLPLRGCLYGVAFTAQSLTFYKLRKILRRRPQVSLKTTEFNTDSINFPASRPTLQVIYLYFTRNLRILSSPCTSNLLDQKHVPRHFQPIFFIGNSKQKKYIYASSPLL